MRAITVALVTRTLQTLPKPGPRAPKAPARALLRSMPEKRHVPGAAAIKEKLHDVVVKYSPPTSLFLRRLVFGLSGILCKLFIMVCRVRLYNYDSYMQVVEHRAPGKPLITAANHASCLDDPLLFAFLPWRVVMNPFRMRWSLGAREICFANETLGWFFGTGHVIPIVRGAGIYQNGMHHALAQMAAGGWIHIFPEGKVNQIVALEPFRWGVGRLVMESPVPPVILPFWHRGMERILPEPGYPQDVLDIDDHFDGSVQPAQEPVISASVPLAASAAAGAERHPGGTAPTDEAQRMPPAPSVTIDRVSPPEMRVPRPFQRLLVGFGEPIDMEPVLRDLRARGLDETEMRIEITRLVREAVRKVKLDTIAQVRADKVREEQAYAAMNPLQRAWAVVRPFVVPWRLLSAPMGSAGSGKDHQA